MLDMNGAVESVTVITTENRGMNAEEWAEAAVRRIVFVSMDTPMPIR